MLRSRASVPSRTSDPRPGPYRPAASTERDTMIEDTTADPTDRIGNSPADHLYENAMLTVLVACFISFWLVTAT